MERPSRVTTYERGTAEFDRAPTFFDAVFAVALTLLVMTLDRADTAAAWRSLDSLLNVIQTQLLAFGWSFAVIAFYWFAHHKFVASLQRLSAPLLVVNLVFMAFVVLLPFTTEVAGDFNVPLTTAVYAGNLAILSSMEAVMWWLGWSQRLMIRQPPRSTMLAGLVPQLVPPLVFAVSIPLAYLASASAARLSWLSLLVLNPLAGSWARQAAARGASGSA